MRGEMYQKLNGYLADTNVMYIKLHNLHWNVVGKEFKNVHEYLETLYTEFALVLDEIAEILKINGQAPLASMKEYLECTSIQELESKEVSIDTVIKTVIKDIEYLKTSVENIRKIANDCDAYDVVSMTEGHLNSYNKTLWFVTSMAK